MKAFAYHLPDHPIPARRQNIWRGVTSGDVDACIKKSHPGQCVIVRYAVDQAESPHPWRPPPGYYDVNSHLWRELLPNLKPL